MYFGFSFDFMRTLLRISSASSNILKEFLSYPREKAILPSSNDAFETYVCYNLHASALTYAISC